MRRRSRRIAARAWDSGNELPQRIIAAAHKQHGNGGKQRQPGRLADWHHYISAHDYSDERMNLDYLRETYCKRLDLTRAMEVP
jgi:hypothetical protein